MDRLRLGMIGCGAVTELYHLPAVSASESARVTALVDPDPERARLLAGGDPACVCAEHHREIVDRIDAAVVAVPNHLHAPVSLELIRQGIPVLVEKPMALSSAECSEMISLARREGLTLAVGHMRRFVWAARYVKDVIEKGLLGPIRRFDFREGSEYRWNVQSDFPFRSESGGGILLDMGVHVLDLLLWWLGDFEEVDYRDDAMGGVESECEVRLRMKSGAVGFVELSRTRNLRNSYVFEGSLGKLEAEFGTSPDPTIRLTLNDLTLTGPVSPDGAEQKRPGEWLRVLTRQIDDFAAAVLRGREPAVPGEEAARAIRLIEACRERRRTLRFPWVSGQEVPLR